MIWLLPTLPASHISLPLALPKTFPSCCSASTRIISTLKVFAAASPECSFQILFHVGYPRAWQFREFFSVTLSKSAFSSPVPDVFWNHTIFLFYIGTKAFPVLHVVRNLNTAKDTSLISHFRNDAKDHFIPLGLEIMGSLCMCSSWKRLQITYCSFHPYLFVHQIITTKSFIF